MNLDCKKVRVRLKESLSKHAGYSRDIIDVLDFGGPSYIIEPSGKILFKEHCEVVSESEAKEEKIFIAGVDFAEALAFSPHYQLVEIHRIVKNELKRRGEDTPGMVRVTPEENRETELKQTRVAAENLTKTNGELIAELEKYKYALEYFGREYGQPARDIIKNLTGYGGLKNA